MNQLAMSSLRPEFGESRCNNESFGENNFGDTGQSSSGGPGTCPPPPDVHPSHPSQASGLSFFQLPVVWDESVSLGFPARGIRGVTIPKRKLRRKNSGESGKAPPVIRAPVPPPRTSIRPIRCRPLSFLSARFPSSAMHQVALFALRSEFRESRYNNEKFGGDNFGEKGETSSSGPGATAHSPRPSARSPLDSCPDNG